MRHYEPEPPFTYTPVSFDPSPGFVDPDAPPKRPGRGGRRAGAGAPRGNMNALKHGLRSKQFAALGAILAADPKVRQSLLALADRHQVKRRRAQDIAALILVTLYERAQQIAHGRLNVEVPVDDWRTIKQAADNLRPRRYGPPPAREDHAPNNQTSDTDLDNQSEQ